MKGLIIAAVFATGFGLGMLYANRHLEEKCNEIVEKEFESFREFRRNFEKKYRERESEKEDNQC